MVMQLEDLPSTRSYTILGDDAFDHELADMLTGDGREVTIVSSPIASAHLQGTVVLAALDVSKHHSELTACGVVEYWNLLPFRLIESPDREHLSNSPSRGFPMFPSKQSEPEKWQSWPTSPWWLHRQACISNILDRTLTPAEIIQFAECSMLSGFEVRLLDQSAETFRIVCERLA
jgi:hypothetical protein